MKTKSECPSAAWDRYFDSQDSAEAEVIHQWVQGEIERIIPRIGNKNSVHRDHFKPADGWPEDPAIIADEITNLVSNHGILIEAIMLLWKTSGGGTEAVWWGS
tara:strand:- start:13500 stop:13808 length:309 start_codon:yes stop_codon:yes gene_type:complete